jgi:hypothetical protein
MLKKITTLLVLSISFFSSCNEPADLSKFRLTYDSFVFFTEENTQVEDAVTISAPVTFDLDEDMIFHGSQTSDLTDCYVVECDLEIESPNSADFTFLKEAQLYLMADSTLPVTLFAAISDVPEAVKRFVIPVNSDKSVLDFLKNEKYELRILFNSRRTLTEDVKVKVTTHFMVHTR